MPENTTAGGKREEIIEIASRLFYEQGYGATGIKQIIDEAAIAKGTFYTHFRSKEELGLAWLRARHAQWGGWFEEATNHLKTSAQKILKAFSFLEEWISGANFRGCAFINTMAETPDADSSMRNEVARHKTSLLETFQDLAIDHFKAAGLTTAAARQKGTAIYLLFEGSLVEAQNFNDTWPIQTARKEVKAMLKAANST